MTTTFSNGITSQIADFLERTLLQQTPDWWARNVLAALNFNQKAMLDQKRANDLFCLDLAALLRVMDYNWSHLSDHYNFGKEDMNYLKEMMTIRNKWAHMDSSEYSSNDASRDLDTLLRFSKMISADTRFQESVERELKKAMRDMLNEDIAPLPPPPSPEPKVIKPETVSKPLANHTENVSLSSGKTFDHFSPGDEVTPINAPELKCAILKIVSTEPEYRYEVLVNNEKKQYYHSQLIEPCNTKSEFSILDPSEFKAKLTSLYIENPTISTLYSLNSAKIDFISYQFRPVIKFIKSDRPRMLIADSVGVGKTIEAGLILRELQARRDIRSVLIICPKPLIVEEKWLTEMTRFDESFTQLNSNELQYCINELNRDGEWPWRHAKTIIPYSLLDDRILYGNKTGKGKKTKGFYDLDVNPHFDLVIVDEAHHLRNSYTSKHKVVKFFCENAEAAIFLTATPIQLGDKDLFTLLNILRPDLILDKKSFDQMAEPNPHINMAVRNFRTRQENWREKAIESIQKAESTSWGTAVLVSNPELEKVKKILNSVDIKGDEVIECINILEGLHTFSSIINRTRRCDIGDFTVRKPRTVSVDFTPQQRDLHDAILEIQTKIFSIIHPSTIIKFIMTTIKRQVASCLFGLKPFLENILCRHLGEIDIAELNDDDDIDIQEIKENEISSILQEIQDILTIAKSLPETDPKFDELEKIIKEKQCLENNKVMLFSSFKHTLNYLYRKFVAKGYRVGLIHGEIPDDERRTLRERFMASSEKADAIDILLFSEVGCEGLDYQFCDCIVNYDLPWNPMRIEQRIGRIDRNGQQSPTVLICNLITPGTIDAAIYERCFQRIGVFERSIGDCEEILGEITSEIRKIAENYKLTDQESSQKLQQLSDNKIRELREQQKLEEQEKEFFGLVLPKDQFDQDVKNSSTCWLSSEFLENLISIYLAKTCGEGQYLRDDKKTKSLKLSADNREKLLKDLDAIPRQTNPTFRGWEKWLKGSGQLLQLVFDSKSARQDSGAAFITPVHPLIKQAAKGLKAEDKFVTKLIISDSEYQLGEYLFVLYQWHFTGIKGDYKIVPICDTEFVCDHFDELMSKGRPGNIDEDTIVALEKNFQSLESKHHQRWSLEKKEYIAENLKISNFKRESLKTSHNARVNILSERLSNSNESKIRRMRESELYNAKADYERRLQELDDCLKKADIETKTISYGIIEII